jgi:hypothetical protein
MERCLDWNCLVAKEEKLCMECGTKVGGEETSAANMVAILVGVLFYVSLAITVGRLFVDHGPSFTVCMMMTFALMFIMRSTQDGVTKVKKR